MRKQTFIDTLPFSQGKELTTLVENKRSFGVDQLELHVFETYKPSELVPLRFDDMVFINMVQGKKVMHLNNVDAFEYLPGQMMLLPAYAEMHIDFPEATMLQPTQCTALIISEDKIKKIMDYLNEFFPKQQMVQDWNFDLSIFHLYNTPELVELLNKLFRIMVSTNPLKNALADIAFKELVIKMMQAQSLLALDIGKSGSSVLLYLKDYIKKNITEKISIEILQQVANLSKASLTRLFNQELGVSPMEYVISERLRKAKKLLKVTQSVKESCFGAGFNDVNYFVRLFKNREGITPGSYMLEV